MAVLDILGDGSCVAHYALEKDVTDTGGAYNGTPVSVTFVDDAKKGSVGNFNGLAYVRGPSQGIGIPINNNQVKTVTCWFYASSARAGYNVWSSGKSANGRAHSLLSVKTNGELHDGYTNDYSYTSKFKNVPYDQWNFCAVAGDRVYLNGSLAGVLSSPIGSTSHTYGFYLGANGAYDYGYVASPQYGMPIVGMISDLRIFNKALTDKEAMAVYLDDGKDRERKHVLPTPIILATMPHALTRGFR